MTSYFDPYSTPISSLTQQIGSLRATPHGNTTANGAIPWQSQLANLQTQLQSLQGQQDKDASQSNFYNGLMTPSAMPTPTAMPKFNMPTPTAMPTVSPMPAPTQFGGMGGDGAMLSGLMNRMGGGSGGSQGGQGGVGNYTSGITAGVLPQTTIDSASASLMKPVSMPGLNGALGQQLSDLTSGEQSSENVNLLRDSAAQQAKLNLTSQTAQANAGLNWSDLLARLNEAAMRQRNAVSQPLIGQLLQAIG